MAQIKARNSTTHRRKHFDAMLTIWSLRDTKDYPRVSSDSQKEESLYLQSLADTEVKLDPERMTLREPSRTDGCPIQKARRVVPDW